MSELLSLKIFLRDREVRAFVFDQNELTIGRDAAASVHLDNTGVSREHARIERRGGAWLLRDLGSANGTALDGARVREAELRDGSEIAIGKFRLLVGLRSDRRGLEPDGAPALPEGETIRLEQGGAPAHPSSGALASVGPVAKQRGSLPGVLAVAAALVVGAALIALVAR